MKAHCQTWHFQKLLNMRYFEAKYCLLSEVYRIYFCIFHEEAMCYHKPFGAIIISPMVRAGMIFFSIIKNQHFYCVVHDKLDGRRKPGRVN